MREHELTAAALAELVNDALAGITGRQGATSERTVFRWLSGENRWPHARIRRALESVAGVPVTELGFVPRRHNGPARDDGQEQEMPVLRRTFLTAAAASAAAATGSGTSPAAGSTAISPAAGPVTGPAGGAPNPSTGRPRPAAGSADVIRLRDGLDTLMAADDARGGSSDLERAALAGAREALALQQVAATGRTRQRLFSLAANYTATAAWSCIDSRRLDQAEAHLNTALRLAGLAQDAEATMRVWNSNAMLAHQRGRHAEAVAAAQAAQSTAVSRRDPLYASLAHARTAVGHSNRGERQSALRCLGYAGEALAKAPDAIRPSWIAFYGPAELHALTAIVRDRLGDAAEAEAASHRALSVLPHPFRRNRALATSRLALAQLHQGDVDQACETTEAAFRLMSGAPLPGRMRTLLGDFHRDLFTLAPSATAAHDWADRYRTEWSRSA